MVHLKLRNEPTTDRARRNDEAMLRGGLVSTFCQANVTEKRALEMFHDDQYHASGDPSLDLRFCSIRHRGCHDALSNGTPRVDVRWFLTCKQVYREAGEKLCFSFADQYTLKAFVAASNRDQRRRLGKLHLQVGGIESWTKGAWSAALTKTSLSKLTGTKALKIDVEMTAAPNVGWKNSPAAQRTLVGDFIKFSNPRLTSVAFTLNERPRPQGADHLTWPERRAKSAEVVQTILDPTAHNQAVALAKQAMAANELTNLEQRWRRIDTILRANDEAGQENDKRARNENSPVAACLYVVLTRIGGKGRPATGDQTTTSTSQGTNPLPTATAPLAADAPTASRTTHLQILPPPRLRPQPDIIPNEASSDDSDSFLGLCKREFHWGLYLHYEPYGGLRYTIDGSSGQWVPEYRGIRNVQSEPDLVGLYQVADLCNTSLQGLAGAIQEEDAKLNADLSMDSDRWMYACFYRLATAGFLKCEDIEALREKIVQWGDVQAKKEPVVARRGRGRRPIGQSIFCDQRNGYDLELHVGLPRTRARLV